MGNVCVERITKMMADAPTLQNMMNVAVLRKRCRVFGSRNPGLVDCTATIGDPAVRFG
jgi:hypothetical protein